jgi:hypothetical protein
VGLTGATFSDEFDADRSRLHVTVSTSGSTKPVVGEVLYELAVTTQVISTDDSSVIASSIYLHSRGARTSICRMVNCLHSIRPDDVDILR